MSSLRVLARPRSLYGGEGQLVFCDSKSTSFKRPSANLVYFTVSTHQIDGSMPSVTESGLPPIPDLLRHRNEPTLRANNGLTHRSMTGGEAHLLHGISFLERLVVITFPGFDADIRQLPVCALG